MNVQDDPAAMAALRALGARSVPVVARGDRFVFAQLLNEVTEFLEIETAAGPELSAATLAERLDLVLETAARLIGQFPEARLGDKLLNRDRSYRVLCNHVFRITEAFLETMAGTALTHEMLTAEPGPEVEGVADITGYGAGVRARLQAWWEACEDREGRRPVETYFGRQTMHEVLERTTWHTAQHVRQLAMALEMMAIEADRPLDGEALAGLPLPEAVWDG